MATRKILIARPQTTEPLSNPQPESSTPSRSGAASRSASATRGGRSRAGSITTGQVQQQHRRDANMKTKFVIRRLPPLYSEAEFKAVTAEYINPKTVEWSYYVQGKVHRSKSTPTTYSRAYAKFKDVESLIAFNKAFGGKVVKDTKGNESAMQIEFAPYEKISKTKVKKDARQDTIDNDPEFLAFQESLSAPPVPAAPPVPSTESGEGSTGVQTTPLIEYLRTMKLVKKSSGGSASRSGKKEKEKGKKEKKKREREKSKKNKGSEKGAEMDKPDVAADALANSASPQSGSAESGAVASPSAEKGNAGKESRHRSRGGRDKKRKDLQSQQSVPAPKPKMLTPQSLAAGVQNVSVQATSSRPPAPAPLILPAPTVHLPQVTARTPSQQAPKDPTPAGIGPPSGQASEASAPGNEKSQPRHRRGGGGRGGKADGRSSKLSNNGITSAPAERGSATTSGLGGPSGASGRGGRSSHRGGRRHHGGNRGSNDGAGGGGPPSTS